LIEHALFVYRHSIQRGVIVRLAALLRCIVGAIYLSLMRRLKERVTTEAHIFEPPPFRAIVLGILTRGIGQRSVNQLMPPLE
jgi:hypothetical protein